jgi:hypothetical protein
MLRVNPIWKATRAGFLDAVTHLLVDFQSSLVHHGCPVAMVDTVQTLVEAVRQLRRDLVDLPNTP